MPKTTTYDIRHTARDPAPYPKEAGAWKVHIDIIIVTRLQMIVLHSSSRCYVRLSIAAAAAAATAATAAAGSRGVLDRRGRTRGASQCDSVLSLG